MFTVVSRIQCKSFIVLPIRLNIFRYTVVVFTRQSIDKGKCDECIGKEKCPNCSK